MLGPEWSTLTWLITKSPSLLAAYAPVTLLAATSPVWACAEGLERPCRPTVPARAELDATSQRAARLPAAPKRGGDTPRGTLNKRYLLLPGTRK